MSTFKIDLKEINDFKKQLSSNSALKSIVPDMTLAVLQLHNTLEKRIIDLFNAPGVLSDVLIGKSVAPESLGNTFLRYNLQYRVKPIPLSKYPYVVTDSNSFSTARGIIPGTDRFNIQRGQFSEDIKVSVRKGKPSIARQGPGNFDKRRGFLQRGQIKARVRQATWNVLPTSQNPIGTRAAYTTLFGPSLAELANKVYEQGEIGRDKQVVASIDRLQTELIDSFVRFYS